MHLMEERLLPHEWTRTTPGTVNAASGLTQPGEIITGTALMDVQDDTRIRFGDNTGMAERRGDLVAFTHDTEIRKGDRVNTAYGIAEVVYATPWDDLAPPHRELSLRLV